MNNRKQSIDQKDDYAEGEFAVEIPDGFECPITTDIMVDPVIASDGHSYEQVAMEQWLAGGRRISPMTGEKLSHTLLTPNHSLKKAIQIFLKQRPALAAIKKELHANRSLEQQMGDLIVAIKLREDDLAARAAKHPGALHMADAQEVVDDENKISIKEPIKVEFHQHLQPTMEEVSVIEQQRNNTGAQNVRTTIASTLSPQKTIDVDNWVVSVVNVSGIAVLVVEGAKPIRHERLFSSNSFFAWSVKVINDEGNMRFLYCTELTRSQLSDYLTCRRESWNADPTNVNKMHAAIQADLQADMLSDVNERRIPYHQFIGADHPFAALFEPGHNSASWCNEKLRIAVPGIGTAIPLSKPSKIDCVLL